MRKLEGLRGGVKKSLHKIQKKTTVSSLLHKNCAKRTLKSLHEVQQLHRRKLPEPLLNILVLPFKEDPASDLMKLAAHEVDSPPDRAQLHKVTGWIFLEWKDKDIQ